MKKRKMPPHIVLPDGRWRFVKKGKSKNKRNVVQMAKRRGRKRYFSRARSYARRARSIGGGGMTKNILDGLIVGVAQTAIPDFIPMQDPLIAVGVGWFRKNPTLTTLGGIQLGAYLGGMVGGGLKLGGGSQV
jgi:hypothetical protein